MLIAARTDQTSNRQDLGTRGSLHTNFILLRSQHTGKISLTVLLLLLSVFSLFSVPRTAYGDEEQVRASLSAVVYVRASIPPTARTARFLGTEREASGVVIDAEGLVLTIGYIILEATEVEVVGPDGRAIPATIIGNDYETGFGLLRAQEPLPATPMPLGLSSELTERAEVLVASYGVPETVQPTFVTGRREFSGYWEYLLEDAIFTSPPHPRFAGAALIGPEGQLLGIGSLFVGDAFGGEQRLPGNMFIPIDSLKPILPDLLATGRTTKPPRPWLGIFTEEVGGHLFVAATIPDGPAAQAGLRPGDIIVGVGDKSVKGQAEFYRGVWSQGKAGVTIPLQILRESQILTQNVSSIDRDQYFQSAPSDERKRPSPPNRASI